MPKGMTALPSSILKSLKGRTMRKGSLKSHTQLSREQWSWKAEAPRQELPAPLKHQRLDPHVLSLLVFLPNYSGRECCSGTDFSEATPQHTGHGNLPHLVPVHRDELTDLFLLTTSTSGVASAPFRSSGRVPLTNLPKEGE